MDPAISVSGLVKTYGRTRALDGLDVSVETGEVHGFLGPNGAGKTTTIRVLLGLLRANTGRVTVLGANPRSDAVALHRRLAYVPGDVDLWPNLTGGEVIDLFGRLRGSLNRRRRNDLCDRFDLDPTKKGRTYSRGNRQKVALIAALASDVELLLLDEPTAGLDPLMEVVFQDCLREARAAGTTALLSSHILAQVKVLADCISIIRLGRVVESGSLTQLRHLTRTTIVAETDAPAAGLVEMAGVHGVEAFDGKVRCDVDAEHLDATVRHLAGLGVRSLVAHPPTLEQLLLRHYGDDVGLGRHRVRHGGTPVLAAHVARAGCLGHCGPHHRCCVHAARGGRYGRRGPVVALPDWLGPGHPSLRQRSVVAARARSGAGDHTCRCCVDPQPAS